MRKLFKNIQLNADTHTDCRGYKGIRGHWHIDAIIL